MLAGLCPGYYFYYFSKLVRYIKFYYPLLSFPVFEYVIILGKLWTLSSVVVIYLDYKYTKGGRYNVNV
jgi:hypothetical protein